ncbi:hypothetical protein CTI14_29765 [Methylobacterium radiotolerans]|nr:hypothetical protein CTI14_29765 [Methylobacterium radiotolerans]
MPLSFFNFVGRLWHRLTYQPPRPTDRIAYMVGWETAREFAEDKPNPYPEGTEQHHSWHWGFQDARGGFARHLVERQVM